MYITAGNGSGYRELRDVLHYRDRMYLLHDWRLLCSSGDGLNRSCAIQKMMPTCGRGSSKKGSAPSSETFNDDG